jgi:membrane associated rhomboid family serine protease
VCAYDLVYLIMCTSVFSWLQARLIFQVGTFLWGGAETQRALVYDPHHREQLWRFLTYMLLHSNSLHLALNIAIQCLLAAPLEHEQGHLRTSLVYFGGVLGGKLTVFGFEYLRIKV